MKLTKTVLVKLINEMMDHGGLSCGEVHPAHTHHEWEDHKREEDKKTKAMAKISIKPTIIAENEWGDVLKADREDSIPKDELRDILKNWAATEYESDEHRWQEYAADIEDLVAEPLRLGTPEEDPMQRDPPSQLRKGVMKET